MKIILRASPVLTLTDTTSVWSASLCVQFVYLRRLCVILVTNTAVNLQTFTDPHQDAWAQEISKSILQCFGGRMDHSSFVSD